MAYVSIDKAIQKDFIRNILASGPGAVAVISADSLLIHYYNRRFEQTFDVHAPENGNSHIYFSRFLDEAQQSRLKAQIRLTSEHPEARNKYTVFFIKTADATVRSFYTYVAPVEMENETLYHLLILPDLSRWPVPFISFDTRELFLEQFNTINFGTFEWIIAENRLFCSDRLYDIYDIDDRNSNPTRETLSVYTHPDYREKAGQLLKEALETGKTGSLRMKIITAKKNLKVVEVMIEPLSDENGMPLKLLGSMREVTDQYKTEEDLKRNVSELNRSNRELEEFAYVASHDLQEPLRKISTFSDRLIEKYNDLLEGEGKMYLERIIASAGSMRMLIDNLLDFSRLSKSTQPFTDVNLAFVLREVKTELELTIEETGTKIKSEELPKIDAVHSQMKQLFTNILNNAIKFRKEDLPPVISIINTLIDEAEARSMGLAPGTNYYKIQVTDNGIGFEDEYAQKIFQIFQRLHAKSEYPGSGIGLAICKKIVDNHYGAIYAENLPGEGARFTIILPEKQHKQ